MIHEYTNKDKPLLTEDNKTEYKVMFSLEEFTKSIQRYEEHYRLMTTYKLERSLMKYVTDKFTILQDCFINGGVKGFEMNSKLLDEQGNQYSVYTNAISAGGYNIQEFHYRYITKVSSK